MTTKTKTLIAAGAIAAAGLTGLGLAHAQADSSALRPGLQNAVDNGIVDEVTAEKLQTYNHEQMQQRMQERQQERIDSAVENGTITQDEANQIRGWQNDRPEAMQKLGGFGRIGGHGSGMGYGGDCPMND